MAESQGFRVLVVAPGETPAVVHDAVTAVAAHDRKCVDEVHVLTTADAADRLRAALLKPGTASKWADRCRRLGMTKADILFGRRTIHALGSGTPGSIANDALSTLRTLCGDSSNDVTIVAASDAGVLGILAHSALQLAGKPTDRFFVLDVRPMARDASKHRRRRDGRMPRPPALMEVQTLLDERSAPPSQSYEELATSRRLARRRLSQPGIVVLDGSRRIVGIDDVELSLPRLQFFWMYCLATLAPGGLPLRALSGDFEIGADGEIRIAPEHPQRAHLEAITRHIGRVFAALFPEAADEFPFVFKRACGPTPGLPSVIAKLNASLKRSLGAGAEPYLIAGGRGAGGYRLTLPPAQIRLVPRIRVPQAARQHGGR